MCAKCNKSGDEVAILPPGPTPEEQVKSDGELQKMIKTLSERKRRTFMRYMKKGKRKEQAAADEEDADNDENATPTAGECDGSKEGQAEAKGLETVPYSKEELLLKLSQMRVDDDDDDDDSFGSDVVDNLDLDDFSGPEDLGGFESYDSDSDDMLPAK